MKLVLVALALAAAPSGLAMGPFIPDKPSWACNLPEDFCGDADDCKICASCTDPGWDCYHLSIIPCESGEWIKCGPPGNCKGVEKDGDRATGTVWLQSCCSSPPVFATCPEECTCVEDTQ